MPKRWKSRGVESLDVSPHRVLGRSPEITMSHCGSEFYYKSLITKSGSDDSCGQWWALRGRHVGGLWWGGEIQLFVYIHFPHSDYFINCPAFISSLPRLPLLIISSFIPHHKHTIAALWIQRICLLLTESRHSLMIGQRQTSKSAILFVSGWQPTKVLITFSQVIRRRRRVR